MRIFIDCALLDQLSTEHSVCGGRLGELRMGHLRQWNSVVTDRPVVESLRARADSLLARVDRLGERLQLQQLLLQLVSLKAMMAETGGFLGWQLIDRTSRLFQPVWEPLPGTVVSAQPIFSTGLDPFVSGFPASFPPMGSGGPLGSGGLPPLVNQALGGNFSLASIQPSSTLGIMAQTQSAMNIANGFLADTIASVQGAPVLGGSHLSLFGSGVPNLAAINPTAPGGGALLFTNALSAANRLATAPLPGGSSSSGGGAFSGLGTSNFENLVFRNTTTNIGLKTGNLGL